MKIETFFKNFALFASAPDALARIRLLVLDFAIKGKLTRQNPNDEPAEHLLIRAHEERNQLIERGMIKRVKALEDKVSVSEFMALPKNWTSCTLDEISLKITDGEHATPARVDLGHYLLSARNVRDGFIDVSDVDYVGKDEFERIRKRCDPDAGDILLSCSGSIGRVAVVDADNKYSMVRSAALIKHSKSNVDSYYLSLALRSPNLQRQIARSSKQSAQANLFIEPIRRLVVPLPPLAEQKRIVVKVKELMALCDRLEAMQQERETCHAALARASISRFADAPTPTNLNFLFHNSYDITPADLRKAILSLAVRGKLVLQDRKDEPSDELLKSIAQQRAKLLGTESLRKTKPCRPFDSDETPHEIPATWSWAMLGEITDIGTGSTPSRTESSYWEGGTIPWVTSGSTSQSPITEGDEFVTPAAVKAHRLRVYKAGTLLVALYGQGKTRGQVAALEISATINQACAAICPLDGIPTMQGYLKLLLEKQYDEMRSLSAGGAQPNLNVQKIKEVLVPLPPLAEQRRIVTKVDQLMTLVDQLETQLAASRSAGEKLMEAVVAELTSLSLKRI